ncbi:MAG: hypothetical protein OXE94_06105 [Aestuariivita sp.]|nr:hypothetical protein [Aestuariivita sp.]MCY4201452.1 hypothetical protein [Aestuariivita sp.]
MPAKTRKAISGRNVAGKVPVTGIKDHKTNQVVSKTVETTDRDTLFAADTVAPGFNLHTDDH